MYLLQFKIYDIKLIYYNKFKIKLYYNPYKYTLIFKLNRMSRLVANTRQSRTPEFLIE